MQFLSADVPPHVGNLVVNGLREPAGPPPDRTAIAVLPFVNMSNEPRLGYFSDGITDDIAVALSKVRSFRVVARNVSFSFRGNARHLQHVAEEFGVRYLVDGSVRKNGDRVRVTARLSDTATRGQLWAERYDRRLDDMFAVQDEISDAIVAATEPQVYAAEHLRAAHRPCADLPAQGLAMRALSHFWRMSREDNAAAQALLRRAVEIDPNCAQARAILAISHIFGGRMGWEERKMALPTAQRSALAALRADDEDPWAYLALGTTNLHLARFDDALAAFDKALSLNPNFALAQAYCGQALADIGRGREAVDAARRALRLSPRDPFSPMYKAVLAYAAFVGRDYDAAMREARWTIRRRPDYTGCHRVFVAAAAMKGEIDAAKEALQGLRRAQPNISLASLARQMPFGEAAEREHYQEGFRRIGLE